MKYLKQILKQLSIKIYTKTHKIALYFMFIHWENTLNAHQHISYCSIQRDHFKKNNFNIKSDQNIHQDASNCTFFLNFLAV